MKPYYKQAGVTIYHGDCAEVLPTLKHNSVRLLWTDPPYGHSNHVGDLNSCLNEYRGLESAPIANDSPDLMRKVVGAMLRLVVPVLCNDHSCCCCCCSGGGGSDGPTFAWLANKMNAHGLQFFHSVIWDKRNPGLGWRFRRQHEMIMVAHKRGAQMAWANKDTAVSNIISLYPPKNRMHPNEKPKSLVGRFIEWTTEQGDTVLDPFLGSGTTLLVAQSMNRKAIGIELDEKYCEIAAKRLVGKTFSEAGSKPLTMRRMF